MTELEKSVRCPVCCAEPGSPCLHPRRATTNPQFWEPVHTHRARIIAARVAQRSKKVIVDFERKKALAAEIVAIKPATERVFNQFHQPGFRIPDDFDELPADELAGWLGEDEEEIL